MASDGAAGNRHSYMATMNADGRYVAFESIASNLVPGDTNGWQDVFVHDRETRTTERVSVSSDGAQANQYSWVPSFSADGRYVVFFSAASNLVPGDTNNAWDVFVHDRETRTTQRVSVDSDGGEGNGFSLNASISADGRYVAFDSLASNLVLDDTNGIRDVFIRDLETGTTERVSVPSATAEGNDTSWYPSVSANGRFVAFSSFASNLVPRDTNDAGDVFVRDRDTGTTERVSVDSAGAEVNNTSYSFAPSSISADGRYVGFYSLAINLVPGETNRTDDVFVHDRETGATERVSVASDGAEGNDLSRRASVSANGRFVAFYSWASNLVSGDTNITEDAFVRDRGPAVGVGEISAVQEQGDRISISGWSTFSGQDVALASDSPGDGALGAEEVGAELTGASLTFRPEHDAAVSSRPIETVLIRWPVTDLPEPGGGFPGVVYGLEFDFGGERYEVRALQAITTSSPPAAPFFALHRCAPVCVETARLSGGIGTTGDEVRVALPLASLDASPRVALTSLRAYTALGEAGPGEIVTLDEVTLPDAFLPPPAVALGIAPQGTPESDVVFDTEATLAEGNFSGSLNLSSLSPGDYDVWAKACLADVCGAASAPMVVGDEPPSPGPTASSIPEPFRRTYPVTPNDPLFGDDSALLPVDNEGWIPTQWALRKIQAPQAWQEDRATGMGIRVAVIDTGVDLGHIDLSRTCAGKLEIVAGADFVGDGAGVDDRNGHGTHSAGIIGACTNNERGMAGVAPDATIMPVRVLDADGGGDLKDAAAALKLAADSGAHVANLSLSTILGPAGSVPDVLTVMDDAVDYARSKGVVMIAAAGDGSGPLCEYPSMIEDVICVGATDSRDQKAWYSTFPVKADEDEVIGPAVVAPGGTGQAFCDPHSEEILSTYPLELDDCSEGISAYRTLSGTSVAAPHVAGIAALVYDRIGGERSAESAQVVIDAIVSSADDLGPPDYDPYYGFGRVNALEAVRAVIAAPDPDPTASPTVTPTESPEQETTDVSFTERSATAGQYSDETLFEARLTDSGGDPIAGAELIFELTGSESSRSFTEITDADGVASVTPTLDESPGPHQLTVRFAGDEAYDASADTTTFVVDREDSDTELTVSGNGNNRTLRARLSDRDMPSEGIAGRTVDFYADGELIGSATTDDDGVATLKPPPRYRGGKHDYEARFKGDDHYLGSSDERQT